MHPVCGGWVEGSQLVSWRWLCVTDMQSRALTGSAACAGWRLAVLNQTLTRRETQAWAVGVGDTASRVLVIGGARSDPEGERHSGVAWASPVCTDRIIRQTGRQVHVGQHEHGHGHDSSALSSVDVCKGWAGSRP